MGVVTNTGDAASAPAAALAKVRSAVRGALEKAYGAQQDNIAAHKAAGNEHEKAAGMLRAMRPKDLRRLADWLDALAPAGGFAELAAGLVIIECANRWREKHKEDEPDSLAAAITETFTPQP
jgi:hypothetical protein